MFRFDTLEKLLTLNIGVSQGANEEAFRLMDSIHPLTVKRFRTGMEHNGWVVPHNWVVRKGLIKRNGDTLFDGTVHPMAIARSSSSFKGVVPKDELDRHVFFSREFPDAYVYHSMYDLRPWIEHWGFCVPYNLYANWPSGDYEIELESEFVDGEMLVGELSHKGELTDTIVFNAHTCHPCQANDDMVGVMVIIALFKWLATQETRYSYRGVLAPEHVGTAFYVADLPEEDLARLKLGCFVEMVGTETPFALQWSFTGRSIIDRVAKYVLGQIDRQLTTGDFSTVVGNDETVWEAPGIEIPMISISRWPYEGYHTSGDNLDIISEGRMTEALNALQRIIGIFERDCTIERQFTGMVALSNPKYGLYKEHPDPALDKGLTDLDLSFARMQDRLTRYFDGQHTVFEIAETFDVPFEMLREYIGEFEQKGLVKLHQMSTLDDYKLMARTG